MPLDPAIAAQVAHLFDATLAQILSGEVETVPPGPALHRDDVVVDVGEIPGPGGPVPVRTYRPAGAEDQVLPALVWAHGGGWMYGDVSMPEADSVAQIAAATVGCHVVSVDYRLAPTHTHPAALDDVVAAVRWAIDHGDAHGIDSTRVALGGASAGAHLAASAALVQPGELAALLLAYPVTDPVGGPYPADRHPDCPPVIWLDRDAIGAMFGMYLGADPTSAPASIVPGRADPDALAGLPPTLVTTAECDGLTPQGERFVELLAGAGVEVTHHEVDSVLHGYLNTLGDSNRADAALERHLAWLTSTFADD